MSRINGKKTHTHTHYFLFVEMGIFDFCLLPETYVCLSINIAFHELLVLRPRPTAAVNQVQLVKSLHKRDE